MEMKSEPFESSYVSLSVLTTEQFCYACRRDVDGVNRFSQRSLTLTLFVVIAVAVLAEAIDPAAG